MAPLYPADLQHRKVFIVPFCRCCKLLDIFEEVISDDCLNLEWHTVILLGLWQLSARPNKSSFLCELCDKRFYLFELFLLTWQWWIVLADPERAAWMQISPKYADPEVVLLKWIKRQNRIHGHLERGMDTWEDVLRRHVGCSLEQLRHAFIDSWRLMNVLLLDHSVSEQGQTGYTCCFREAERFTRTKLRHLQISTSLVITSLTDYRKFNPVRSANREAEYGWMLRLRMLKVDYRFFYTPCHL